MTRPLLEYFGAIVDYRSPRKKKHRLDEMLICLLFGFLAGKTTIARALNWCNEHLSFLRQFIRLENGIASKATISRMLAGVADEELAYAFTMWAADLVDIRGRTIILDGQGLIAGTKRIDGERTPYVMNVIDAESQLAISQFAIPSKTNEITALMELLPQLNLKDTTVLIDAIGTQVDIMTMIVRNGGHFLLTLKKNQLAMYEEVIEYFQGAESALEKKKNDESLSCEDQELIQHTDFTDWNAESNRERNEYRRCMASDQVDFITKTKEELPFIQRMGVLQSVRIMKTRIDGIDVTPSLKDVLAAVAADDGMKAQVQAIGLITDRELSPLQMMQLKRTEWRIENGLHHVLHESFREDRCPAKEGKNNLAILRKITYDLLRLAITRDDIQSKSSFACAMDDFCAPSKMNRLYSKYLFSGIERVN